jgi:hypothetical protein
MTLPDLGVAPTATTSSLTRTDTSSSSGCEAWTGRNVFATHITDQVSVMFVQRIRKSYQFSDQIEFSGIERNLGKETLIVQSPKNPVAELERPLHGGRQIRRVKNGLRHSVDLGAGRIVHLGGVLHPTWEGTGNRS